MSPLPRLLFRPPFLQDAKCLVGIKAALPSSDVVQSCVDKVTGFRHSCGENDVVGSET